MNPKDRAPMSDADFEAVRALAAQGRPIPAIVMAAIVARVEAQSRQEATPENAAAQPQIA